MARLDSDLVKQYTTLAKRADQRLVRLEKLAGEKGFENVKQFAYKRAVYDIKHWSGTSGKGKLRFNKALPTTDAALQKRIKDIERFLNAPTSTKKGVTKVYKNKADALNKKYGTKFSWQELAKFHESGLADKMNAQFGSKTALKIIGEIQKSKKEIVKAIDDSNLKDIKIGPKSKHSKVRTLLKQYGLDIKDLL